MAIRSLNRLRRFQHLVFAARRQWYRMTQGVILPASSTLSISAKLRSRRRGSIRIGDQTLVAFKTLILATDPVTGQDHDVTIGSRCFIGGGSMILPGVSIGDGAIVAAGAVVAGDVPPASIVGGNPARVIRQNIAAGPMGRLQGADAATRRLWRE